MSTVIAMFFGPQIQATALILLFHGAQAGGGSTGGGTLDGGSCKNDINCNSFCCDNDNSYEYKGICQPKQENQRCLNVQMRDRIVLIFIIASVFLITGICVAKYQKKAQKKQAKLEQLRHAAKNQLKRQKALENLEHEEQKKHHFGSRLEIESDLRSQHSYHSKRSRRSVAPRNSNYELSGQRRRESFIGLAPRPRRFTENHKNSPQGVRHMKSSAQVVPQNIELPAKEEHDYAHARSMSIDKKNKLGDSSQQNQDSLEKRFSPGKNRIKLYQNDELAQSHQINSAAFVTPSSNGKQFEQQQLLKMKQMASIEDSDIDEEMKRLELGQSNLKAMRVQQSAEVRRESKEFVHPDQEHQHLDEVEQALDRLKQKLEIGGEKDKLDESCSSAEIKINVDRQELGLPERNQSAQGNREQEDVMIPKTLRDSKKSLSKLLDEYGEGQMHPIDEDLNREDEITPAAGGLPQSNSPRRDHISPRSNNQSMVSETTKQDVSYLQLKPNFDLDDSQLPTQRDLHGELDPIQELLEDKSRKNSGI